jgi:hypothetical protein
VAKSNATLERALKRPDSIARSFPSSDHRKINIGRTLTSALPRLSFSPRPLHLSEPILRLRYDRGVAFTSSRAAPDLGAIFRANASKAFKRDFMYFSSRRALVRPLLAPFSPPSRPLRAPAGSFLPAVIPATGRFTLGKSRGCRS